MKQNKHFFEAEGGVKRIHDVTAGAHPLPPRRRDDGNAFLPDPYGDGEPEAALEGDVAAEGMARDRLSMATSGGADAPMESQNAVTEDEDGGPFVEESGRLEFADGVDGNNPPGAERSPFPAPMREGAAPARRR